MFGSHVVSIIGARFDGLHDLVVDGVLVGELGAGVELVGFGSHVPLSIDLPDVGVNRSY